MTLDVRLGAWGCRADRRGLASQTAEVCRHLQPAKVFGIDMKGLSPYYNVWDDYDPDRLTVYSHDEITPDVARGWLDGLDVVWGAETFYFPWFTGLCHEMGVRTVLACNPEFMAHVLADGTRGTDSWAPIPDRLCPPTDWRLDLIPQGRPLRHGVCRHRLPYRPRTRAHTFLHVAGHPAAFDRAGTQVVLEAAGLVTRPCVILIRSQQPLRRTGDYRAPTVPAHVSLRVEIGNPIRYATLYDEGDVLLTPRRYGGQHLPMSEALSTGMPVLASDIDPQNRLLPAEMLVPGYGGRTFYSKVGPLPLFDTDPRALAIRMDQMVDDPAFVERLSKEADQIAARHAWPAVIGDWHRLFNALVSR